MLFGAPITVLAIAIGAYVAVLGTTTQFERTAYDRLRVVSQRSADLVDQYLRERLSDVLALARLPTIRQAALEAHDRQQPFEIIRKFLPNRNLRNTLPEVTGIAHD